MAYQHLKHYPHALSLFQKTLPRNCRLPSYFLTRHWSSIYPVLQTLLPEVLHMLLKNLPHHSYIDVKKVLCLVLLGESWWWIHSDTKDSFLLRVDGLLACQTAAEFSLWGYLGNCLLISKFLCVFPPDFFQSSELQYYVSLLQAILVFIDFIYLVKMYFKTCICLANFFFNLF